MRKKLRIGITIGLHQPGESLWVNGIKQNAIFLAEALAHCRNVKSVCLVNMTAVDPQSVVWDQTRWPVLAFDDAREVVDVVIELGGQLSADQTAWLKGRGKHLVSYCCGVEYIQTMEAVLFDRPLAGANLFINPLYDSVWVIPQVAESSEHFFRTLRRCETQVVPFLWSPVLLEEHMKSHPTGGTYRPRSGPARLVVAEPNIDVVKFCMYPALIAEEAFRRRPQDIARLQVANSLRIATSNADFIALMNHLDIVRAGKALFTGREDLGWLLAESADVMVSHQWSNALNYVYLEACWQGFPLVHNAHLCRELGYFYEGNDVQDGCRQLLAALQGHDAVWEDYRRFQREAIGRFMPGNAEVTSRYEALLGKLVAQAPRRA